jgi:hypothetical protein
MNLDITDSVNAFREILQCSWKEVSNTAERDTTKSFREDWMQANWERIVEASQDPNLNVVIEPYGDGADCNIRSSRVWKPDAIANARVCIRYVGNEQLINVIDGNEVHDIMTLDYFCAVVGEWPEIDVPFDHAVLQHDELTVVPVRDLKYYLQPI